MKAANIIFLSVFLIAFQASAASAYLDPGTGSLILQGMIGGLLAGWAVVRLNYTRLKSFFSSPGKKRSKQNIPGDES